MAFYGFVIELLLSQRCQVPQDVSGVSEVSGISGVSEVSETCETPETCETLETSETPETSETTKKFLRHLRPLRQKQFVDHVQSWRHQVYLLQVLHLCLWHFYLIYNR